MRYHRRTRQQLHPWMYVLGMAVLLLCIAVNTRLAQSGLATPFAAISAAVEIPFAAAVRSIANAGAGIAAIPGLNDELTQLRKENAALKEELVDVREAASTGERDGAIRRLAALHDRGIVADCIGYDPENVRRSITIDKGSLAGVMLDAGVITADGVVGRVSAITPISSTVLLLNSYTSNIPAIVQQGRFWGIVRGSLTHLKLDNVALDAPMKLGDFVVTGRGRSFPAGLPIGKIISISRSDAALTQTAVVAPSVDMGRLERLVVLPLQ